jgi:HEAT repeat protein
MAVLMAGEIKARVAGPLKEILTTAKDPDVQQNALLALAQHGGEGVDSILLDAAINNPNDKLAEMAVLAMREYKGPFSADKYLELLGKSKSPRVRRAVLMVLADDKGAVPWACCSRSGRMKQTRRQRGR